MPPKNRLARHSYVAASLLTTQRLLHYGQNMYRQVERTSPEAGALLAWARQFQSVLDISMPGEKDEDCRWPDKRAAPTQAVWRTFGVALDNAVANLPRITNYDPIAHLTRELGFDNVDTDLLWLFVDYKSVRPLESLWDGIQHALGRYQKLRIDTYTISLLTGHQATDVAKHLHIQANLRTSGLVRIDPDSDVLVQHRVLRLAGEDVEAPINDIRIALLGHCQQGSLKFSDFVHLGRDADVVLALLKGALAARERGVNILVYGPPGTGKTEFCKTLAASLEVTLISIAEEDEHGAEPTRGERLGDLQLAQRLLATGNPSLILFDEAEDLMSSAGGHEPLFGADPLSGRAVGSRAFMHRLLEQGPSPVLWTANSLSTFPPAILRRMTACIEVAIPPTAVRAALWSQIAQQEGVDVASQDMTRLARLLPAAPALARSAMRAARLAGGSAETATWAVAGVVRAMNSGRMPVVAGGLEDFDPELVSADIDLGALAARLATSGTSRAITLLLSGPPGSGKSAYARYLAGCMGLEVTQKRVSDLFSPYIGETEKAIAAAFKEALASKTFLIFDEADSLLADRRGAHRSWEVSQVNELLCAIESHPFPVVCTTNLLDRIDPAAMRRFIIKATFGYLQDAQLERAWRNTFSAPPPRGLSHLNRLTPADFSVVRKKAEFLGGLDDPSSLLAALEGEQVSKPHEGQKPIGFRIAA